MYDASIYHRSSPYFVPQFVNLRLVKDAEALSSTFSLGCQSGQANHVCLFSVECGSMRETNSLQGSSASLLVFRCDDIYHCWIREVSLGMSGKSWIHNCLSNEDVTEHKVPESLMIHRR